MRFSAINDILNAAIEVLRNSLDKDIEIIRHYPERTKPLPINRVTVTIGSNARIVTKEYIGDRLTEDTTGRLIELMIEASAYVPFSKNSALAYQTLDRAVSTLMNNDQFDIVKVKYGTITTNRNTGCFELHATLISLLYETEG